MEWNLIQLMWDLLWHATVDNGQNIYRAEEGLAGQIYEACEVLGVDRLWLFSVLLIRG